MYASTHVLPTASPSSLMPSPVALVSEMISAMVVAALVTVVPAVGDVMATVQLPVAPIVVHELRPPTNVAVAPLELVSEKVISVPAGALTKVVPELMLTCAVSVWLVPISLTLVGGL